MWWKRNIFKAREIVLKRKDKKESKGLGEETKLSVKERDKWMIKAVEVCPALGWVRIIPQKDMIQARAAFRGAPEGEKREGREHEALERIKWNIIKK